MNWKAVKTSAFLSILFLVVYGTTNWLTSLRHDVPTFYFQWERHIPFVPLMIIPYMSIDLFFVAAPFLCTTDVERTTFSRRIIATILIAGACFMLFPLRFAFARPAVAGWLGVVFNNFRNMDRPFNQLPSLHIALRTILADLYSRHTKGILKVAAAIWFSLIGFSTLLTYQHHVIDIAGGFALAAVCFYLIRDTSGRLPVTPNLRVGIYYTAGAGVVVLIGVMLRPWGLLLIWPAISLAVVAGSYFGLGPGIFRKVDGKLPFSTWVILWPVLVGQRFSLIHYARICNPWDRVTPGLWIGRRLTNGEARKAIEAGVTAVLDLTGEFSEVRAFRGAKYRQIPVMDLTAPTRKQIEEAIEFIRVECAHGVVYVHCKVGFSRSAAVAGAYLLASGQSRGAQGAIEMMRRARPSIVIRPEALKAIETFADDFNQSVSRDVTRSSACVDTSLS